MSLELEFTSMLSAISPYTIEALNPPMLNATVCGVIMDAKPIKKSHFGRRDYTEIISIKDPTGFLRMNFFHATLEGLPQVSNNLRGDIIIAKNVKLNLFNQTKQAVSTATSVHAVVTREESIESLRQPWITDTDRKVITILKKWWNARYPQEVAVVRPQSSFGRSLIEVHAIADGNKYFDIILQVIIKLDSYSTNRMLVFLTDYTINPSPPYSFVDTGMAEVVEPHLVIQGTFWDNHITTLSKIQPGEIIRIKNAVKSVSPQQEIEFNLHTSNDMQPLIQKLSDDDPAIQPLLRRKAAYEQNRLKQRTMSQQSSQQQMMFQPTPPPPPPPQQQSMQMSGHAPISMNNHHSLPSAYTPAPFSWQAFPQPTTAHNQAAIMDDVMTEVREIYSYKTVEELFNVEVGSKYYTRASILDFKPKNFGDWIRKFCSICNITTSINESICCRCGSSELESTLMFSLLIKDTENSKMLLNCFQQQAVNLFPGIDLKSVESSIGIIKGYIEQSCPIIQDKQMFLDFGIERYEVNDRGKMFKITNTTFTKV